MRSSRRSNRLHMGRPPSPIRRSVLGSRTATSGSTKSSLRWEKYFRRGSSSIMEGQSVCPWRISKEAAEIFQNFLDGGRGWIENSIECMPAVGIRADMRSAVKKTLRVPCCAAWSWMHPGRRYAVILASIFGIGGNTSRRSFGTRPRRAGRGTINRGRLSSRIAMIISRICSYVSATTGWEFDIANQYNDMAWRCKPESEACRNNHIYFIKIR